MEHIAKTIRNNRQWLKQVFENDPEIGQIREEFYEKIRKEHGPYNRPLIATGHQPVIYYPGLLFKDYFVGEAAARQGGSAWNIIVDTDEAEIDIPVPVYDKGEWQKTRLGLSNEKRKAFAAFSPASEETEKFMQSIESSLATLPGQGSQAGFY